jgi:heptose I phosphotransferase
MKNILFVPDDIKQHLLGDTFDALMQMPGKAFRDVPGRKTIQVSLGNKSYFIKQHFGVGWGEIFKNLISFKKPILGAMTEVSAIQKLHEIGIASTPLIAYGQRGCNPASLQSFVLTEDLGDIITLEDVFNSEHIFSAGLEASSNMASRPAVSRSVVSNTIVLQALAKLAAKFHSAGLAHRDFYLCHFVIKKAKVGTGNLNLHLIDLHRVLQGQNPNSDAVMKDIAGLYFSMQQIGLGAEDLAVFKQYYLSQTDEFWVQVETRSQALLTKFNSEKFQQRLAKEKSAIR